jgi:phytoene dehydrogenase-like protein
MKVAIIGAGVSGLSAGCYLQMNGFDTEIFEMHSGAGGLCTSWKRGGFTFNASLHWLMGSGEGSEFYKLWSELIDLKSINFYTPEIRLEIETLENRDRYGSNVFRLYTDLGRLQSYMTDLAPEDAPEIRRFIRQIRKIQSFEIPPKIRQLPQLLPWYRKIGYARYLPMLFFLRKYGRITSSGFAARLKNPFLREAFLLLFDGEDLPILIHTIPLAYFDKKSAGYPSGGAAGFTKKLEEKYASLGGTIHYNCRVDKILVENNAAKGIKLHDGSEVMADFVVSAADWRFTLFEALGKQFLDEKTKDLGTGKRLEVFHSVFSVFLGISRPFEELSGLKRFPLESPLFSPDGTTYDRMEVHVHNYDPSLAPAGKTVISVSLYTQNGEYWINLRESDPASYEEKKGTLSQRIIEILDQKFGEIKGRLEQASIATPATFQRYTNNWRGSIQGWLPQKKIISASPVQQELSGLKNFYLAGHWTMPGGGLPVAIKSARDVAMMICQKSGRKFRTTT